MPPKGKPFIRHISGNTLDNRRENLTFTGNAENSDALLFTKPAQQRMLLASRIIEPEHRQRALDAITSDPYSLAERERRYAVRDLPNGELEFMHRAILSAHSPSKPPQGRPGYLPFHLTTQFGIKGASLQVLALLSQC